MKPVTALAFAALLAACSEDSAAPPPAAAATAPPAPAPAPASPAPVPVSVASGGWDLEWQLGKEVSLVNVTGPQTNPPQRLVISCRKEPAGLVLSVDGLAPVASEERLVLGVDEEPFLFVAEVAGDTTPGVTGSGPPSRDFLRRLKTAETLMVNYGATNLGPFPAPSGPALENFPRICGDYWGAAAGQPA